jgi:hypothetical protein
VPEERTWLRVRTVATLALPVSSTTMFVDAVVPVVGMVTIVPEAVMLWIVPSSMNARE